MPDLRVSPDRLSRQPPTNVLLLLQSDMAPGRIRANGGPRLPASFKRGSGTRGRARAAQRTWREDGMGKEFSMKPLVVSSSSLGLTTTRSSASGIVIPDTAKER